MRAIPFVFGLCATFALLSGPASAGTASKDQDFFATHAMYGRGTWLAVPEANRVKPGEKVAVFEAGKDAVWVPVKRVIPTQEAKATFDKLGYSDVSDKPALWDQFGGYWYLKGPDEPKFMARLTGAADRSEPVMALRGLPAQTTLLGSKPTVLPAGALDTYLKKLPLNERIGNPMYRGVAFESSQARIVDMFVGHPRYSDRSKKAIRSVLFKRYTFVNAKLVGVHSFRRVTGEEERADTEAPVLTSSNWYDVTEKTVGFVKPGGNPNWYRLTIDIGFEGLNHRIETLAKARTPAYEAYHYTPH